MLVYVTFLVIWGVYQGRKVKNCCDYAIAGRNLPGWAAALSERATGESSWALLGLPGAAYGMLITAAIIIPYTIYGGFQSVVYTDVVQAVLITGAIAAMVSTADSLLVLSATELSENILPNLKNSTPAKKLIRNRIVTALLAVIALGVSFVAPSKYIFTIVSYVWAGIGGTFSIVILLTLFWKKYHGRAVILTIAAGLIFTILWVQTGMDKVVPARMLTFFVALIAAIAGTYLLPAAKSDNI